MLGSIVVVTIVVVVGHTDDNAAVHAVALAHTPLASHQPQRGDSLKQTVHATNSSHGAPAGGVGCGVGCGVGSGVFVDVCFNDE